MTMPRLALPILLGFALGSVPGAFAQDAETGKGARPALETEAGEAVVDEAPAVDPSRFVGVPDEAFGAYQRGAYLTALKLALPRAESGDPAAQTLVAEIYAAGLGVRQDPAEASKWFEKAAEQGVPDAQLQFALVLLDGKLVPQDRDRAFTLMRSAAEAGKPLAQFNLAQMLTDSGKVREAVGWYEKAAIAKLPDAQYAMAQVFAQGIGGKIQNMEEARRWLGLSARSNFDTAQLDLGTWLVEGRGGPVNYKEGFAWLKRAADSGNIAARNRVAKLYQAGVGVEPDPILAAAWYMSARQAGLVDDSMEGFLEGLTDEQIKAAEEHLQTLL